MDMEYYRLRSFSITSHGICNLGDSMRRVEQINWFGTANCSFYRFFPRSIGVDDRVLLTQLRRPTVVVIETIGEPQLRSSFLRREMKTKRSRISLRISLSIYFHYVQFASHCIQPCNYVFYSFTTFLWWKFHFIAIVPLVVSLNGAFAHFNIVSWASARG